MKKWFCLCAALILCVALSACDSVTYPIDREALEQVVMDKKEGTGKGAARPAQKGNYAKTGQIRDRQRTFAGHG